MSRGYIIVKLHGGPADGEQVSVDIDVRDIRIVSVAPLRPTCEPISRNFRALQPVFLYRRDVNYPDNADYVGREDEL